MNHNQKKQSDHATRISSMFIQDQKMRNQYLSAPETQEWDSDLDQANTEHLKQIIDEIGWPSVSRVGEQASRQAWTLVQHADHDIEFQKYCLQLMRSETQGEVAKWNIAFLEDRICVNENRSQIYGTQFYKHTDGSYLPHPIKHPEKLDQLREQVGLESFTGYSREM